MPQDLNLQPNDYNHAYLTFIITYVVFGIPANIIFRIVGPKFLTVMMVCWGKDANLTS
jgi:hypothetical protein